MEGSRGLVKLFGMMISLPAKGEIPVVTGEEGGGGGNGEGGGGGGENSKVLLNHKTSPETKERDEESPNSEEKSEPASPTGGIENHHKSTSADQQTTPAETLNPEEEEQNDASNSQEKTLKKPDKILPCPRCNSMDTKFCYYNNYNVNQPRHFCKNCQRYWTAGGTMRNVPVGAGRRKNKHSSNHYRHITVSEATLQTIRSDIPESVHHPATKPNGTILSFGSDMPPLCESMASVLNLAEKSKRNGFPRPEHLGSSRGGVAAENGEELSSGSSVTTSNCTEDGGGTNLQEPTLQNAQGYPPQVPWPHTWNPSPAFCDPSFPIPFYPTTAYWGCAVPVDWSVPWLSPLSSPMSTGSSGPGPNSPTLGKHSRDGDVLQESNSERGDAPKQTKEERCLWIPKTLRIDDPEEAAKSSIWATLGIKNGKANMISGGGLFRAFHPMAEIKNHGGGAEASPVWHANPAALSRSLNFQESS